MTEALQSLDPGFDAAFAAALESAPSATAIVAFSDAPRPVLRVAWRNAAARAEPPGGALAALAGLTPCAAVAEAPPALAALLRAGGQGALTLPGAAGLHAVPLGHGGLWALHALPPAPSRAAPDPALGEMILRATDLTDVGVAVLDEDKRFEWASAAILARLGVALRDLVGRRIGDMVGAGSFEYPDADEIEALQRSGAPCTRFVSYITRAGVERHIRFAVTVVRGADGRRRIISLSHDMTELARARRRAAVMERAIEHATDPVLLLGSDTRIMDANRAFTEMFGYSASEARGHDPLELLRVSAAEIAETQDGIARVLAGGTGHFAGWRTTRDGRRLWMETAVAPLPEDEGTGGYVLVMRDRTEQHRLELEQSRLNRLLAEALRETRSVALAYDHRDGSVTATAGFEELVGGLPMLSADGRGLLRERIHPDDIATARSAWSAHWRGETDAARAEFRMLHPVRGPVWVRAASHLIRDEQGAPAFAYGLLTDIDAEKRRALDLMHAKSGAEKASQEKSSFLAAVSHEIRTPMNVITGVAQLLQLTPLDARQEGYVAMMATAARDLLMLIDDLLDLSRIEAGVMRLRSEPFDIATTARQVVEAARVIGGSTAPDAVPDIALDIAPGFAPVRAGDGHRVRQVLANLVGNAVKFAPGQPVTLSLAEPRPGLVRVEVADGGPGIPEDVLPRLFQRFRRGDESTSGRTPGTGLGLAISREIIELMGGRIGAANRPEGGALFWAEIPLDSPKVAAEA